jgi:hypothetical protein
MSDSTHHNSNAYDNLEPVSPIEASPVLGLSPDTTDEVFTATAIPLSMRRSTLQIKTYASAPQLHTPTPPTGRYIDQEQTQVTSQTSPQTSNHQNSINSSATLSNGHIPKTTPKARSPWISSWWWWWELGAALLSMTSMLLIILVLFKVQDKPLGDWHFSIQPNSLISVLTTLGKTAMLVAVAESIGQLKWLHFDGRSRPLDHFQQFDEASRGPWGSAMLIWGTKGRAILASIGAFITIVGLGIEPSAQQILGFPSKLTTVHNSTATLGIADMYWSKALVNNGVTGVVATNLDLLRLQTAIVNGMVSQVAVPNFLCPDGATICQWDDLTTLGVCNTCEDVTNTVTYNCSNVSPSSSTFICDYQSPKFSEILDQSSSVTGDAVGKVRLSYDPHLTESSNQSTIFSTFVSDNGQGIISVKPLQSVTGVSDNATANAPPVQVYMSSWAWCARSFKNVTATPGVLPTSPNTSEILWFRDSGDSSDGFHTPVANFVSNTTGKVYQINFNTNLNFWSVITSLLSVTEFTQDSTNSNDATTHLDFGGTLAKGDIPTISSNIADTLTAYVRSFQLDNPNATSFNGTVQIKETYVKVRWAWLILPLAETLLASLLLIGSIVISMGHPVWKNSVTASLFHGLDGSGDGELAVHGVESLRAVDKAAQGMHVELQRNGEGILKLLRV